jgi:uncharacterized protein (DUF58 family)
MLSRSADNSLFTKNIAGRESLAPASSRVRLTKEGWYWLALCGLLLILGLNKGINLLCLLAYVMLFCLLLNILLAGRRLGRLQGERRIGDPAFAGEAFPVELRVTNPDRRAHFGIGLEDHEPMGIAFASSSRLGSGQTAIDRREVMLPTRGRYRWGSLEAVSGYPFGLAQRRVQLVAAEEVLILPRLGRLHRGRLRRFLLPLGLAAVPLRRQAHRHPTAQVEFHGLRAFRSGDSPRWIHWRTSARCGELMVREFEDLPTDNLIVVLDPAVADDRANLVEDAISLTATICWEWCRQKGDRLVLAIGGSSPCVIDGTTSTELAVRALEALASLTGEKEPDQAPLVEKLAGTALPPASMLVISTRDPGPLQAALALRLHRSATGVNAEHPEDYDFYEKPMAV